MISAIHRFTIPAYWVIFSALTVRAGENPGFVVPDPSQPYPWGPVTLTCVKLAVLSLGLHVLLRPASYNGSIGRVWSAAAVFFAIAAWETRRSVTDMPGYFYMVGMFVIMTVAILLTWGVLSTASNAWAGRRRASRNGDGAEAGMPYRTWDEPTPQGNQMGKQGNN